MLLGGKGGCQQCTCVPCNPCERTCTNPHTGTAFEAVYTRYFEGAEAGNTSDGYLSASGDSDTSDPYDGMDGTGPWFQQVAGTFTLEPSTTRHPCSVTVSFWRNNYVLGAATIPPPATTTTMNRIRVSVSASSGTGVFVEGTLVGVGETLDLAATIPLVTGGGDQSTNDPHISSGSATVTPECHNKTAIFTIEARIEWNVAKRQHVVYGLVRECYEIGTPCSTFCNGVAAPDIVYVTISNYTGPAKDSPFVIEGTYVMERYPNLCDSYQGDTPPEGGCLRDILRTQYMRLVPGYNWAWSTNAPVDGECAELLLRFTTSVSSLCGTGVIDSGTNGVVYIAYSVFSNPEIVTGASFDWEIEV
jgi:hypothetical protein